MKTCRSLVRLGVRRCPGPVWTASAWNQSKLKLRTPTRPSSDALPSMLVFTGGADPMIPGAEVGLALPLSSGFLVALFFAPWSLEGDEEGIFSSGRKV